VTRALALVGTVAAVFGLGSYRVLGELSAFNVANLLLAALCLLAAGGLGVRDLGHARPAPLRGPALRSLGRCAATCALAVALYAAAAASGVRFDWTFEGRFELAPATRELLARLPGPLRITLYHDVGDPRVRNTRLLLDELARDRAVEVRQRRLDQHPEDEDRYGIGSSNSVLLEIAGRWRLVERPSEGALYESLARLVNPRDYVIYVSVGAGEGDLERSDDRGYSGLRAALEAEGFDPRPLPLALAHEIPPDADALLSIAPQRRLPDDALAAVARYLDAGGRLVALLEPGVGSGLEDLLAGYGLASPDRLVVDPSAGPFDDEEPGLALVVFNYADHPLTRGLDGNRMTFFRRARSFDLHKVQPADRLRSVVFASRHSRLAGPGASSDYHGLVATAELERGGARTRIVAFGDSDFASNRYLRALYNLDLMLNAVHWTVDREPAISLRPKSGGRQLVQFPIPLQTSLQALYGVGLLIPELLMLAGGLVWLRQRGG